MTVYFTFSVPKDKNDKSFEKIIINSNVNVCKMMNGVAGDFITKMIAEDLMKGSNFGVCPIKKVE